MLQELKSAAMHEGIVWTVVPSALAAAWFCLGILSIDPPFMGWFLVFVGLFLVEAFDIHRYGLNGMGTLVIALRSLMNFVIALIGLGVSGFFIIVAGPPPPKGPISLIQTVTAFLAMLATARTVESVMVLTTRFDWNAIKEWWNGNKGSDGAEQG